MDFLKVHIFDVVGVISLIVGILAFIDGRSAKKSTKNEKAIREYLFDVAEKNIDKDLTEDHINQLKKIETELSVAIHKQIPILAKKTALINSLEELKNSIAQNYIEYQHIQEELKDLDVETAEIPEQISDIVVKNILPDYYRRKEKEKNLIIIAVLFLMYIIIGNTPMLFLFQYLIAIFMYNPLSSLLELTFPKHRKWKLHLKCFYSFIFGIYAMLVSLSGISTGELFESGKRSFVCIEITANNIFYIALSFTSYFLISFAVGIELKTLMEEKVSAYVNIFQRRKIIVYLSYYIFWGIITAIIIFMSLFIDISYRNEYYKLFNYRLLHFCLIGGVVCFTALVVPCLPSKLNFSKKLKKK